MGVSTSGDGTIIGTAGIVSSTGTNLVAVNKTGFLLAMILFLLRLWTEFLVICGQQNQLGSQLPRSIIKKLLLQL